MKHSQTVNRTRAMLETANNQNHMTIREINSIICSGLSFKFSYLQARSADSESTESVQPAGNRTRVARMGILHDTPTLLAPAECVA